MYPALNGTFGIVKESKTLADAYYVQLLDERALSLKGSGAFPLGVWKGDAELLIAS